MELAPIEAFQRYGALGPDFLTWLLVRVLEDEVPGTPCEPGLKVDMQGPLVFTAEGGEAKKVSLAGEEAASAPEVLSALRQGKKLARARVLFTAVQDTWGFTLDSETFDLRSIKLPVPSIADVEEHLRMRIESTMRLFQMVDELFEVFLSLRLSAETWKSETQRRRKLAG